jgi:2'-hydroxyisoflavone reductase
MRVLFFGGTGFVGRHAVSACLSRGHDVTLFCRGRSDPGAFPTVDRVLGERTDPASLAALGSRRFDAVIDTCGYLPREVRASVQQLAPSGAHYVFVSTISVYVDFSRPPDESTTVADPIDADDAVLTAASYGGLKVACEHHVQRTFASAAAIVRPGRILGPFDSDPRMPWLLRRIAHGGDVLTPGTPADPLQQIDARDLGAFLCLCAEERVSGTFNAVSPPFPSGELYSLAREVTGSDARFRWVPDEVLTAHGVTPFGGAPFWLPRAFHDGLRTDASRAVKRGLRVRALRETIADEWAWLQTGWDAAASVRAQKRLAVDAGLSPELERAILAEVAGEASST